MKKKIVFKTRLSEQNFIQDKTVGETFVCQDICLSEAFCIQDKTFSKHFVFETKCLM